MEQIVCCVWFFYEILSSSSELEFVAGWLMAIGAPSITWDLTTYRRSVCINWYTSAKPFGEYCRGGMWKLRLLVNNK